MQIILTEQEYNVLQHKANQADNAMLYAKQELAKKVNEAIANAGVNVLKSVKNYEYNGTVSVHIEWFTSAFKEFRYNLEKQLGTTPATNTVDTTKPS